MQNSIDTPLLVVDTQLRLTRFSPTVDKLIPVAQIREQDFVTALPWRDELPKLKGLLRQVIESHQAHRSIVRLHERVWQMHITPFIDSSNRLRVPPCLIQSPGMKEPHVRPTRRVLHR